METTIQDTLTFLGAAGTVTGSKTLLESSGSRILIDCGLFQGLKELRQLNWVNLPISIDSIDVVLLTHAHLDHCGYLPVLAKNGYKGPIHCTQATKELTNIILLDSAKIQEEDAERANTHNYTKHKKAKPLYTVEDVHKTMKLFVTHDYNEWVIHSSEIKFCFRNSGHILGAAMVEIQKNEQKILFSGDLGRAKPLLLYPRKVIKEADVLILESTYGDRIHSEQNAKRELQKVILDTYERKGILMIPTFAVERAQELMFLLHELRNTESIPDIPIYLDSPMGINATNVYDNYPDLHNLSRLVIREMYENVHYISDYEQSRKIVLDSKPKIVLAGSGMLEGGRIIHYLNNHMSSKKNTLLFVGFQGAGTRGRAILEGAREIKFFGQYHTINCEVKSIMGLSGHADQEEIIEWLEGFRKLPQRIFLNHGEPHQRDALRSKINYLFPEIDVVLPQPYIPYPVEETE
ncbi:MAG: MBL fold metallo-hydrolase [Bacteroidetes bacterium]|nr:MAG: MBL fold metallo-hydrolase [Bacteroidota bacterium]